jgi:hypothetical protein
MRNGDRIEFVVDITPCGQHLRRRLFVMPASLDRREFRPLLVVPCRRPVANRHQDSGKRCRCPKKAYYGNAEATVFEMMALSSNQH